MLLSIIGIYVVKRQGLGIMTTLQQAAERRDQVPKQLMDRFLILLGGVLLIIPGFVTAAMGLLLFLPPVRALIRSYATRRVQASVATGRWAYGTVRNVTFREVRRDEPSGPSSPPPPSSPPEIENS